MIIYLAGEISGNREFLFLDIIKRRLFSYHYVNNGETSLNCFLLRIEKDEDISGNKKGD